MLRIAAFFLLTCVSDLRIVQRMALDKTALVGRDRLREWMDRSKLNQTETAQLLGFDAVFLSQILNGHRRPGLDNAITIERVTGISVESWSLNDLRELQVAVVAYPKTKRNSKA